MPLWGLGTSIAKEHPSSSMNENTKHQAPASACGYGAASQTCGRVEAKRRRANTNEASISKLQ
jgi:hypothetical protein